MFGKKKIILLVSILLFLSTKNVSAINNPREVPNNKFGIHIMNENDLEDARALVNSSNGAWGYVTIVIRKDERNIDRWQRVFDDMRRKQLIPIVRIATIQTPNGWEKFTEEDIHNWVYFLNSLNWVVENRYVIIGNEPNHASEWGGEVNPEEYSDYLYQITSALKAASEDFFVMPAGMDASAPEGKKYMDEANFLKRMHERHPDIFTRMDGWASHSYPNPGFSGSSQDTGRGTIKTYDWELSYLNSLGLNKDLPVFITETGWVHNMNSKIPGLNDAQYLSENLNFAFENVWTDDRIVAVTPFVLNYQDPPFDIFSWKNRNGEFYDFYYEIQKIDKLKGNPRQRTSATIKSVLLPEDVNSTQSLIGYAVIENTGQDIWKKEDVTLTNDGDSLDFQSASNSTILEPGERTAVFFNINLPVERPSDLQLNIKVSNDNFPISQSYLISFPANIELDSVDSRSISQGPRFNALRTVLPIVFFNKSKSDILAAI